MTALHRAPCAWPRGFFLAIYLLFRPANHVRDFRLLRPALHLYAAGCLRAYLPGLRHFPAFVPHPRHPRSHAPLLPGHTPVGTFSAVHLLRTFPLLLSLLSLSPIPLLYYTIRK